jgi:secreted PhoX family phosphatase
MKKSTISRRELLKRTGGLGLGIAFVGSVDSLFGASAAAGAASGEAYGYGPLVPDPNHILDLPEGFSYRTFSKFRDPATGGGLVATRHDGMGAFATPAANVRLVRNHEGYTDNVRVPATGGFTYDMPASGGTMTVELDDELNLLSQYGSLGGTVRNCSGGRTPWGTWLTCEETELRAGAPGRAGAGLLTKDHGWVFEVDPHNNDNNVSPTPLVGMGRYAHEAVAIDPETNVAYLTEDAADPFGLLYRYTPVDVSGGYGSYRSGGTLEAMYVPGVPDLSVVTRVNTRFNHVEWVLVPDPTALTVSTRSQLTDDQVTRSQKLEGASYGRGAVYVVASFAREENGSAARHDGQVWRYEPKTNSLTLELIFTGGRFNAPDNITISPFGGGVVLAEDGADGDQYLVGVAQNGEPFAIARNALNTAELAGVTFSDDHRTLFGNIYGGVGGGLSFAIRGPWDSVSPADPESNAGGVG